MTDYIGPISSLIKIKQEEDMSSHDAHLFESFLLNRLSDIVPREKWDAAVASALEAWKKGRKE